MRTLSLFLTLCFSLVLFWACQDGASILDADGEESSIRSAQEHDAEDKSLWHRKSNAEYRITIKNITPATGMGSSQPMSPFVLATHKRNFKLFKVKKYASDELRQVAEDAVNAPMVKMLNASKKVGTVAEGGLILPGESMSLHFTTKSKYNRLSLVSMLVNTNDAFTGFTNKYLPRRGKRTFKIRAYDAGTEMNTESESHIPGPCCGSSLVRVPTHDRIRYHRGIKGTGDLDPKIYDWNRYVAVVTIERIK